MALDAEGELRTGEGSAWSGVEWRFHPSPFGHCRGSVSVSVFVCVWGQWGQPVLAPPALSCQPNPVPAQARLVPVMLSGVQAAPAPQAAPSWQLLSRGHCGGSTPTVLPVQLQQKHLRGHGNHSSAIKNKYIKLPETNRCLGKGKALTGRATPGQVTTLDALARPKTLLHTLSWDRPKLLEEQEGPWEDKPQQLWHKITESCEFNTGRKIISSFETDDSLVKKKKKIQNGKKRKRKKGEKDQPSPAASRHLQHQPRPFCARGRPGPALLLSSPSSLQAPTRPPQSGINMKLSTPGSVCPAGARSGAGGRQSWLGGLPQCGRWGWVVNGSSLWCHRAEGGLGHLQAGQAQCPGAEPQQEQEELRQTPSPVPTGTAWSAAPSQGSSRSSVRSAGWAAGKRLSTSNARSSSLVQSPAVPGSPELCRARPGGVSEERGVCACEPLGG